MDHELLAIDIGNSRVKIGRFSLPPKGALPEPTNTLAGTIDQLEAGPRPDWLDATCPVVVASVCRSTTERIGRLFEQPCEELPSTAFPIELRVDSPEQLGADRAAAAVGVNRLRRPHTPAIVVDIGTAITIDLISPEGAFEGGAILPGPRLAATALAEQTDALPRSPIADLDRSPDPVGRSTESALLAGLYWGSVGAIRELIDRQRDRLATPPQVFLTGGAAPSVARLVGGPDYSVRHVEHLTLAGIALAAMPDL